MHPGILKFHPILYFSFFWISLILIDLPSYSQLNHDSLLNVAKTSSGKQKFSALKQLGKNFQQTDPVKSIEYAEKERIVAVEMKDRNLEAEALNDKAIPLTLIHENKQAILLLKESDAIYESLNDESGKAMAINNLGIAWSQMGAYEKALDCYLSVIQYYTDHKIQKNLARTYMNLGLVFHQLKKEDQALKAELKAKEIFVEEKNEKMISSVNVNLGIINQSLGKYKEALKYFEDALIYYQKTNVIYSQALVTTNIAKMFKEKGDIKNAILWYNKSLPLIRSIQNTWAEATVFYDLSQIDMQQGKWQNAIGNLQTSHSLNNQANDQELQSQIFYSNYLIYDTLDQENLALQNFKQYAILHDSLTSMEKSRMIEELSIEFETAQKEAENELLKKDIKASKTRLWVLVGLSMAGLVLSTFLIILLIQKRKNMALKKDQVIQETRIKEIELEKALAEKQLQEEAMEKIQVEMQLKEQELVYQTLLRLDLTNINRSVQEKLLPFSYKLSNKKDQNDFIQMLNEITRESNKDPLTDFEIMFTQLHKSFNEKLLTICPSLTKSELQVCALLHTNLSTKDIARLINISPSSIDITRHHIRQKLDLDQKENLTTFLMTL